MFLQLFSRVLPVNALLIVVALSSGFTGVAVAENAANTPVTFVTHMQTKVQALRMRYSTSTAGETLTQVRDLVHVYDRTGYQPIWSQAEGWNTNASRMLDYLSQLPSHGLNPDNYHYAILQSLLKNNNLASRIHADLLFSDAFLKLGRDFSRGAANQPGAGGKSRSLLLRLEPASDPAHEFDALLPQSADYWALHKALKKRLNNSHNDAAISLANAKLIKPGQHHPQVVQLRQRLQQLGFITQADASQEGDLFDHALEMALRQFQQDNGLDADGLLGDSTRAALNRDQVAEIELISLNLERWRQLAPKYADSHVRVNIAAQQLDYVYQGEKQLHMKVIAGREDRPTPTARSAIREVVFNPYWNVPHRIATVDKLPKIRQDPQYLSQHNIALLSDWSRDAQELNPANIDWNQVNKNNFSYFLRQDPGPHNALGQVKFLFPNEYSVYLHDTPGKSLFQRGQRLFSSGCVRLDQPMALAEALLRNHSNITPNGPVQAASFNNNQSIRLSETVPVYLEYWTAWVDKRGQLQLRPDVYQHDAPILAALRDAGAYQSASQLLAAAQHDKTLQVAAN